jgi:hypothetical protein
MIYHSRPLIQIFLSKSRKCDLDKKRGRIRPVGVLPHNPMFRDRLLTSLYMPVKVVLSVVFFLWCRAIHVRTKHPDL